MCLYVLGLPPGNFWLMSLKSSHYYPSLYMHQRRAAVCKPCVCLSTVICEGSKPSYF